jgi:hypothetical protein
LIGVTCVASFSLFRFQLFQHAIEALESLFPMLTVVLDPVDRVGERRRFEPSPQPVAHPALTRSAQHVPNTLRCLEIAG